MKKYWGLTVVVCLPLLLLFGLLVTFSGSWLHNIWINYFWASDKGNGPEALQQTVIYGVIAAVFIPVVRTFVKRELNKVHDKLDLAHEKMDHIIHHSSDIPEFKKD